jgi:opacity protein-like surface antigen
VKVSKAVPILSLGPWLQQGRLNYRPFLVAGVGWYYIDQQLWSANNQVLEWSRADQYSGALIGGGVTFGLSENGTLTLETRYEKVFSPGGTLTFLVPALHLGYLF